MSKIAETPLMLQYLEMKKKHPDAILLFRVGDFYETFSEDAIAASEILGITLTRRANGKAQSVELAGFPHHALDSYLPKLVRAGRRVAICEQLEDPKLTKKLVKRGITELVTPGVNTSPGALQADQNNFLAAIHFERDKAGVAFLDISTGEFLCAQGDLSEINRIMENMAPKELLRMRGTKNLCTSNLTFSGSTFELDDWVYTSSAANERLLKQFSTSSLKGFGVADLSLAIIAAGSILHYLDLTCHNRLSHITSLSRIDSRRFMHLDRFTVRNLELYSDERDKKTLLSIIDKTASPPGRRLLYTWISRPLLDPEEINRRLDCVETFYNDTELRINAYDHIKKTGDLDRLKGRISTGRISPREMLQFGESLVNSMKLKEYLADSSCKELNALANEIADTSDISRWIFNVIHSDAAGFGKGDVINSGIDAELDELRRLRDHSQEALREIQERETAETGISSLKVGFNNVFGYYLEVRNTHKEKVPETWVRKQTLVNAERYITPELKEYEEKIMGAEEKIAAIEDRIFRELLQRISQKFTEITAVARAVAAADCLQSFAEAAVDYRYVRPDIDESTALEIIDGRHPVIERTLPPGEPYISNSVTLDSNKIEEEAAGCQIMMITGPNMSGKSALLRQTALIVLLAQCGSFVPAKKARIGIIDKIFTRVGASDNIASGESTFMVEMNEAASILNNMGNRSLIIFDELGRGTSTYDGISIAWAIVEHIHENGRCTPKTLFATHYHELNEMEAKFPRIQNYNVSVKEINNKVVFLRKLEKGGSEHSFGIHVAKLAGMPRSIVKRADSLLRQLEAGAQDENGNKNISKVKAADLTKQPDAIQMSFFQLDDPLLSQIRDRLLDLDVNSLTPIQALNMLNDLQCLLTGK